MENTERKEALAAIDIIAAEIHAEYVKVADQTGHKLPAWEQLPEEARVMSRTLARLTMSKMEKVYDEAQKKFAASTPAPAPAVPGRESVTEKTKAFEGLTKTIEEAVARLIEKNADEKQGNPISQGVDNAIRTVVEKLATSVILSDEEIQESLRGNITQAIKEGLLGKRNDSEENDDV